MRGHGKGDVVMSVTALPKKTAYIVMNAPLKKVPRSQKLAMQGAAKKFQINNLGIQRKTK